MSFIVGAGITNIDLLYDGLCKIPDTGEEVYAKDFELQLGGGTPATLLNLAGLGVHDKIATSLGNDMFSDFAKGEFSKNGITPLNLYNGSGIPVNISSVLILKDDRSFVTYGNGTVIADDKAKESYYQLARGAKIALMQPDGFIDVYRRLHQEGCTIILDTGWDDELSFEKYHDYLSIADYYTPNQKEALKITGAPTVNEAAVRLAEYFEKPVIKLDKDGCLGVDNGRSIFVPSMKEFNCVDSTGAGDAFLAGFAYGLYYDYPFQDCLLFGNITGGKCVTEVGALSARVSEEELHLLAKWRTV